MRLSKIIAGLYILSLLISCGATDKLLKKDKDKEEEVTAEELSLRNNEYYGVWEGTLKDKRENAETKLIPLQITLNSDLTFKIKSTSDKTAIVNGTYSQYVSSFVFSIKESTISSFAVKGQQIDLEYSQRGKTLELFNEKILLRLDLKQSYATDSTSSEDANIALAKFIGDWLGRDNQGNNWKLTVNDGGSFSVLVSNRQNRNLNLGGTFTINSQKNTLNLLITYANKLNLKNLPMQLIVDQQNSDNAKLILLSANNEVLQELSLKR